MRRPSKLRHTVIRLGPAMLGTTGACTVVQKYGRFIGHMIDSSDLHALQLSVLDMSMDLALNKNSDYSGLEQLKSGETILVRPKSNVRSAFGFTFSQM